MRPLDRIGSIKVKLSLVIVAAVAITAMVSSIGWRTGIPLWQRPVISVVIALVVVYPLSRGLTSPLREMAAASRAMANGDYTHPVTSTSRDEVGELARAFDAMRLELADLDRQRRDLIANVAHELRTPLAALLARFENVADGVEDLDADNIESTLAEIRRLSHLVDQLLDLSRLESGSTRLELDEVDLLDLLEETAAEATEREPGAQVTVSGDPVCVVADRFKLKQVVANLVQNAIRYSPTGEPVELDCAAATNQVVLTVLDRGPGIEPAERQRVLERFYRSDHGRAADGAGAGLGLAIVASIVDLHGGTLDIEANQPSGCRVVVSLPRQGEMNP